jgi:hypothetical protein
MRKEVTDLLLRDFGYDLERAKKEILKRNFGGRSYEELNPEEKDRYEKLVEKEQAFADWFIKDERQAVVDCLRTIGEEVFTANSIYPTYIEELIERRLHQDRAIGQCYRLTQELQYAIETLPVDVNKYLRFADMIKDEINFIKGWRKSDNKFKSSFVGSTVKEQLIMLLSKIIGLLENRAISDSASNFANVNNNGNANYNNASNSNGVRPDFDSVIE